MCETAIIESMPRVSYHFAYMDMFEKRDLMELVQIVRCFFALGGMPVLPRLKGRLVTYFMSRHILRETCELRSKSQRHHIQARYTNKF
jgi:hypothetical protein